MSLMIIDKRNGDVVATGRDRAKVFTKAHSRGVAREDMVFVVGEPDIRVFKIAKIIVDKINWLPQFLYSHGKGKDAIERATGWLNLWQEVMTSRVVDDPEKYPMSLPVIYGCQLAEEIMVVIDAFEHPDCYVLAPATQKAGEEAKQEGYRKARSTRRHLFLLAKHEQLGVYLVAPSTMVNQHTGFKIERVFARRLI